MKRFLTAAALVPAVVWVVLFANLWVFLGVVVLVACLSYYEYNSIAGTYGFGDPGWLGYVAGLLLLLLSGKGLWLIPVALALVALVAAMRAANLATALPRAALLVLGVVYVYGCWRCAIPLRELNPHILMYALIVSWAGDIGAYFVGRKFGAHKLATRVSPNKSWEGAAASVVSSVAVAGAYLMYFVPGVGLPAAIAVTITANIAGQFGDLAESAIKRGAGVKDSGTILPGHGGFLDRVDSALFVLPAVYACFQLMA
jgi:phosphatidate cytidylyltransferase